MNDPLPESRLRERIATGIAASADNTVRCLTEQTAALAPESHWHCRHEIRPGQNVLVPDLREFWQLARMHNRALAGTCDEHGLADCEAAGGFERFPDHNQRQPTHK